LGLRAGGNDRLWVLVGVASAKPVISASTEAGNRGWLVHGAACTGAETGSGGGGGGS
jgi:hypothetical protein